MSELNPDQSLNELIQGNKRYAGTWPRHPHQSAARRKEVAQAQHPFACILSCSDSRVPPEIIFDQGIGDLFVVRVAGNIADDAAIGSLEYAVERLGTPLIVVLGHKRCGAVQAAVSGGRARQHLDSITKVIEPAVAIARKQPGDVVDNAVEANVQVVVKQLGSSQPTLAELVKNGKLKIVGATYDLDTGLINLHRD